MKMTGLSKTYVIILTGIILAGAAFLTTSRTRIISAEEDVQKEKTEDAETDETEEDEIKETQICCPEPDGLNGWYLSVPDIKIVHREPGAATRYKITVPSGNIIQGKLEPEYPENAQAQFPMHQISDEIFEEGINIVEIWMTDKDEKEIFYKEKKIPVDLTAPERPEIFIPEYPDGNNKFFHSEITAQIRSSDTASGVAAVFVSLDGEKEKRFEGDQCTVNINMGYQGRITAYAVDAAGRQSETGITGTVVCEDESPHIEIRTGNPSDRWIREDLSAEVHIKERGEKYGISSGLSYVTCRVGNDTVFRKSWEYGGEVICDEKIFLKSEQASVAGGAVTVTVFACDRAGNTSVATESFYIDKADPFAEIKGVRDNLISGNARTAVFRVRDENILEQCRLEIRKTSIDGKTENSVLEGKKVWKGNDQEKQAEVRFSEDGKYICILSASDGSGRSVKKKISFVIDSTEPVIRYVEQLNGTWVPFFQWNYGDQMIHDLTEYTYSMYLNGRRYFPGTRVVTEGMQFLEVRAADLAGNESSAEAVFTIDHSPPVICWGEIKDGGVYEEGTLFSVWLENDEERISLIEINGEKQKLEYDSRIFQYEILQCGRYRIFVRAEDPAGNVSEEEIKFEVKKKSGLLPMFFPSYKKSPENAKNTEIQDNRNFFLFPAAVFLFSAGIYGWRRSRTGKKLFGE